MKYFSRQIRGHGQKSKHESERDKLIRMRQGQGNDDYLAFFLGVRTLSSDEPSM